MTADATTQSLVDALVAGRVAFASRHASWYRDKKRRNQVASFALRIVAIPALLFGGLCPVLGAALEIDLYGAGYLAIGVAAALLLIDNLFGVSANWHRFMVTALRIEASAELFKLQCQKLASEDGRTDDFFELAEKFTIQINELVLDETTVWQNEKLAQQRMAALLAEKRTDSA